MTIEQYKELITLAQIILHKRGPKERLPELLESEFALTQDTNEVFIGTSEGNKRLLTEDNEEKTVVFVVSGEVAEGVQDPHIVLPYNAEVLDIKAYVTSQPSLDMQFNIEASEDFESWSSITADPIQINASSFTNNKEHVLSTSNLSAETMLRINVVTGSIEARNLTVNIKILRK